MKVTEDKRDYYEKGMNDTWKVINPQDRYVTTLTVLKNGHEPTCKFLGWRKDVYEIINVTPKMITLHHIRCEWNDVPSQTSDSCIRKKIRTIESGSLKGKVILMSKDIYIMD